VVKGRKSENRELEIVEFFKSLPDKFRVVFEAGSNWMWMTDLLDDYGIENLLYHPLRYCSDFYAVSSSPNRFRF